MPSFGVIFLQQSALFPSGSIPLSPGFGKGNPNGDAELLSTDISLLLKVVLEASVSLASHIKAVLLKVGF